eukprot:scaffold94596_cov57-Phaeocystis_antarctica.AAC.2
MSRDLECRRSSTNLAPLTRRRMRATAVALRSAQLPCCGCARGVTAAAAAEQAMRRGRRPACGCAPRGCGSATRSRRDLQVYRREEVYRWHPGGLATKVRWAPNPAQGGAPNPAQGGARAHCSREFEFEFGGMKIQGQLTSWSQGSWRRPNAAAATTKAPYMHRAAEHEAAGAKHEAAEARGSQGDIGPCSAVGAPCVAARHGVLPSTSWCQTPLVNP